MKPFQIDSTTTLGPITLGVASLTQMRRFYEEVVGLTALSQTKDAAVLGIDGTPFIHLTLRPEGKQVPDAVGLFHLAFLLPTRAALGQWLTRYERQNTLRSSADHLYSEAVYIDDPEGNVVELYADRPRSAWYDESGNVKMGTLPLDLDGIRNGADSAPVQGMPRGTILGHVHLQVRDVAESMHFYHELLGFDAISLAEQAGFVGAGGYHHHIGFNTFNSKDRALAPDGSLGLISYAIYLPSQASLDQLVTRLADSAYAVTHTQDFIELLDPSGIKIHLSVAAGE